jgi:uncharacterized protein
MAHGRRLAAAIGLIAAVLLSGGSALAAPKFPALSGRVVDEAQILSAQTESALDAKLKGLEDQTGRQLVVTTVASLQGYEIEDYGYQLGRAWGIGDAKADNGALLIVAPKDRRVRVEVGYGLEPVLTDALSNAILQGQVLPRFKAGDMEGGVVAGADAIIAQLALPADQAAARVAAAQAKPASHAGDARSGLPVLFIILVLIFLFTRGGRGGGASALPWLLLGAMSGGHRGGGWSGGGGGGGGFSGGGGSFGGGGSSGRW